MARTIKTPTYSKKTPAQILAEKRAKTNVASTERTQTSSRTNVQLPNRASSGYKANVPVPKPKAQPKTTTRTNVVRNPEYDKLTETQKTRAQMFRSMQDSSGKFLAGVSEEQKRQFASAQKAGWLPDVFTKETATSGHIWTPGIGQTQADRPGNVSGGQGKGTVHPSQADLYASAESYGQTPAGSQRKTQKGYTVDRTQAGISDPADFTARKQAQFDRLEAARKKSVSAVDTEKEQLFQKYLSEGREGSAEYKEKKTELEDLSVKKEDQARKVKAIYDIGTLRSRISRYDARNPAMEAREDQMREDLKKLIADNPDVDLSKARYSRGHSTQQYESYARSIDKESGLEEQHRALQEEFDKFSATDEAKYRSLFGETDTVKGISEKIQSINDEYVAQAESDFEVAEAKYNKEKAAEETTFNIDLGEFLMDDLDERKQAEKRERETNAYKEDMARDRKEREEEINKRAEGARTTEERDRYVEDRMKSLDEQFGNEAEGQMGQLMETFNREYDRNDAAHNSAYEFAKEEADIRGIIAAGQKANVKDQTDAQRIAALGAAEELKFIREYSYSDEGDEATVIKRARDAYKKETQAGVTRSESVKFSDLDKKLKDVPLLPDESLLEYAAADFGGNVSSAKKYMQSRGYLDSDIATQTEEYQKNILGYTKEQIQETKEFSGIEDIIRRQEKGDDVSLQDLNIIEDYSTKPENERRVEQLRVKLQNPEWTEGKIFVGANDIIERRNEQAATEKAEKGQARKDELAIQEYEKDPFVMSIVDKLEDGTITVKQMVEGDTGAKGVDSKYYDKALKVYASRQGEVVEEEVITQVVEKDEEGLMQKFKDMAFEDIPRIVKEGFSHLFGGETKQTAGFMETPPKKEEIKQEKYAPDEPNFEEKTGEVAERIGISKDELLDIFHLETAGTMNPSIKNPHSSATGLIQFMESTAKGLGTTTKEISEMSATEQLDIVEKYFTKFGKGKMKTIGDVYAVVAAAGAMNVPDSRVVYAKGSSEWKANPGWVAAADGGDITIGALKNYGNNLKGRYRASLGTSKKTIAKADENTAKARGKMSDEELLDAYFD